MKEISAAKREKERRNTAFINNMELLRAAETEHNKIEGIYVEALKDFSGMCVRDKKNAQEAKKKKSQDRARAGAMIDKETFLTHDGIVAMYLLLENEDKNNEFLEKYLSYPLQKRNAGARN